MAKPFFLKKLIIGPPIVPVIYAIKFVIILLDPSFPAINYFVKSCRLECN